MPNYNEGKIYKIHCNTTGEDYYGSTIHTLQKRISLHKSRLKTERYCKSRQIIDRGNFEMVLVEDYPCLTKRELHTRERFYIDNFPNINHVVPTRTVKEYKEHHKEKYKAYNQQYAKEHRQERNEHRNEYYRLNPDYRQKATERATNYYEQNKEKVLERLMVRYVCDCGVEGLVANKSRHEKTKRHQDYIANN